MSEFKKVLGYILESSDIADDEVQTISIAPTVRENTRIYHVTDDDCIDFFAEISINERKNAWGEHLAVVKISGETTDDRIFIYRVEDGYLYDAINIAKTSSC